MVSDIDKVLNRLRLDSDYQAGLISDPVAALAGYELNADDLRRLDRALGRQVEPTIGALLNPPPSLNQPNSKTKGS